MATDEGSAQGAGQEQGSENNSDEFDKDRALATIKTQRESEAAAKKEAAEVRAELKALQDRIEADKRKADNEKLSADEQQAKRIAELEQRLAEGDNAAKARIAKAALKASAAQSGALYPGDVPALVDLNKVKFDKDGEPLNADDLVDELKKSRPALFGERKPGSADGGPRGQAPGNKQDMETLIRSAAGH